MKTSAYQLVMFGVYGCLMLGGVITASVALEAAAVQTASEGVIVALALAGFLEFFVGVVGVIVFVDPRHDRRVQ